MTSETWNVILIVLIVLIGGYALYLRYKRGEAINLGTVSSTLEASIPFANELSEVAQIVVNEIEQAAREGAYIPNEERLAIAINRVKNWSPVFEELETAKVLTAIKSAVLVASALSNQLQADKAHVQMVEDAGVEIRKDGQEN